MASLPQSVVIVGGSLAGLMHGLYLKRHGSNVVILEKDPSSVRSSHQAGIAFGPAVEEFLLKYDATGVQSCTPPVAVRIAYRKHQNFKELNVMRRHLTSWGLLYRILRANFDGLASEAVPNPPAAKEGDGTAEYRAGKTVTKLEYHDGAVTVGYVGQDGKEDTITADLVIGADGVHSTVRSLVGAPTTKEYSGYVAWRGTVSEQDVSPETARYFSSRTTLNFLKGTYLVCYIIPPDSGTFAPGTRLINWVWYSNAPSSTSPGSSSSSTPSLTEVLTSTTGHVHANTVPAGLVRPEIWRRQLAGVLPRLAPPFAELLVATREPFVTKVNDALCERAVFCGGRVLLVGDALAAFRPHFAVATEQAARHCLALEEVWEGRMGLGRWEDEVTRYGKRMWLASRVLGVFGVGGWWEFLRVLFVYVVFLVRLKLGRR
ncbi:hypothetical protein VTK56DRAFT_8161 [Thermocarpiscus australiensis]